ncbi:hypothetical protein Gasu2_12170 [Galdieria sulphuraria]|nr:hypothetical protein Gasu2_12170 [Galdieria sulphuraria]
MDPQHQPKPNTQLQKKLLEQLFQGGVRDTNTMHESHSAPYFLNQDRKMTPSSTLEVSSKEQVEKGLRNEQKRSVFNLGKIGEKILEKRSLRKRVKESATVKQLCARFPELEEDAICAAYAAHGGNKNLTVNYLSRALGSRNSSNSVKENSFSEVANFMRRYTEEGPTGVVQDNQVAIESYSGVRKEEDSREKSSGVHRTVEEQSRGSSQVSLVEQTNTAVGESQLVIPSTNNMALSRRRNSDRVKSKKFSDEQSEEILSHLYGKNPEQPIPFVENYAKYPKTFYPKEKSKKQRTQNESSRLGPEDLELLNDMPKDAKEAFRKRLKKFYDHQNVFFKEDGFEPSQNSLHSDKLSKPCEEAEKFENDSNHRNERERLKSKSSYSSQLVKYNSSTSHLDKEDITQQLLPNSYGDMHHPLSKEHIDFEQSQSSFQILERRILEWNEELHKLDVDTSKQILRLDSHYNHIHQSLDDLYERVHRMECKLDELRQTNRFATVRKVDSYWSSSFWLLLDGIGFILWYCLLKPIVLVYGLFCGKKQRHHRHGSRDSIQFGSGDLSKTLAFLMNTHDKDS